MRLGQLRYDREKNQAKPYNYHAQNIVIRNLRFTDAFDDFPGWGPRDSFKVDKKEFGQGNCSETFVDDKVNPTGCTLRGGRWNSEYDNITVENASMVWIDHNSFSNGERTDDRFPPVWDAPYNEKTQKVQHHDALIDIVGASTKVTVSNNHFKHHDKVGLIGYSSSQSNKKKCLNAGWSEAKCGSYYFAHNNWLNGQPVELNEVAHAKAKKGKSNAPLISLDPAQEARFWHPSQHYAYDVKAPEELLNILKDKVGAGKLSQ